jgi:hypothetical protein
VLGDHVRPIWCHVELFEFAHAELPTHWSFATRDEETFGVSALWGYRSMIQNPSHNDDLMERERSAWNDFLSDNEWAMREGPDQEKMRMLNDMFRSGRTFLRPTDMGAGASAEE